ncbi:MAG TPA: glycosyltransferase family 2 protein [Vicinamibacterales bacterium]|nr:glycosyltransferase family 2 protein [Vicinamibacterales bacterium]
MKAATRRRVSAVVVHHRTPDETRFAVRSLLSSQHPLDRIAIVNNDTADDDGRCLGALRGDVVWLPAGANLGFAGGVNLGVRSSLDAGADAVLLVNSDASIAPDCLTALDAALDERPALGIVGPLVLLKDQSGRIDSMGLRYHAPTGRLRQLGCGLPRAAAAGSQIREVDAVAGCLMLIRREVFERTGFFDEEFFFGFEEIEFCCRARRHGFASAVANAAVAYHEGGRSIGRRSARRLYFAARNHLLLAYKLSPEESAFRRVTRAMMITGFNTVHAVKAPGGSLSSRLAAVARGTADYAAGRFGPDPRSAPQL